MITLCCACWRRAVTISERTAHKHMHIITFHRFTRYLYLSMRHRTTSKIVSWAGAEAGKAWRRLTNYQHSTVFVKFCCGIHTAATDTRQYCYEMHYSKVCLFRLINSIKCGHFMASVHRSLLSAGSKFHIRCHKIIWWRIFIFGCAAQIAHHLSTMCVPKRTFSYYYYYRTWLCNHIE